MKRIDRPLRGAGEPEPPYSPPRLVRAAIRRLKRIPSFPRAQLRKRLLRAAYLEGLTSGARSLLDEGPDATIIEAGEFLRQRLLDENEGRYRRSPYRVLMLRPRSITAEIWFGGLSSCMRHAGVDCRVLPPTSRAPEVNECLERFGPNVLVATEATATLRSLDLGFIRDYKRRHGCLRLFIPVFHSGMPGGYSTPRQDEWRRSLRRSGLSADAHFSIFEPEFHDRFVRDHAGPKIEYTAVPQACNPFTDRPLPERKVYDYFMATSLTDERLEVTARFVRPIMGRYRGLWVGAGWGFGRHYLAPEEMATYYARTRVALSPLAGFVSRYAAELTHRVYAAAACGTFQLTMPTAITGRYFEPDELIQGESPEEYARLFNHYVDRPDERNAVALRALRRVYGAHSCFHRIDQLVAQLDDWKCRGLF